MTRIYYYVIGVGLSFCLLLLTGMTFPYYSKWFGIPWLLGCGAAILVCKGVLSRFENNDTMINLFFTGIGFTIAPVGLFVFVYLFVTTSHPKLWSFLWGVLSIIAILIVLVVMGLIGLIKDRGIAIWRFYKSFFDTPKKSSQETSEKKKEIINEDIV